MDATNRALMNVSGLDILGFTERVGRWILRMTLKTVRAYMAWRRTQRGRKALLSMSDHMLKDLGISRVDAIQYARGRVRKETAEKQVKNKVKG